MRRIQRTATTIAIVASTVTLGLPLASAEPGPNAHYIAGADGIGDPYFPLAGNGGYDVTRYDITGRYDPATDLWSATTRVSATATADLYRFNLDLVGMDVTSVAVNGDPATWTRTDTELVLTPRFRVRSGQTIDAVVTYSGVPQEFPLSGTPFTSGFMATDDGALVAGQPDVAAGWYPVNDHPLDKASYRFAVTVPADLGVVANGFLVDTSTNGGWKTFTWEATEPMASYLATIDIGEWDVREWTTESGLPVYDAVDPDLLTRRNTQLGRSIDASLARQGEVVDVLAERFGPYPFSTVGAIVDDSDDFVFALETQTRPVYSKLFWEFGFGDFVVAHELAHQWFGDDVALARWQDIWLNEGFATYSEWIWGEHEGFFTPQDVFDDVMGPNGIPADDPFWDVVIGEPPADHLFDGAVYLRGGLTLQALRQEVGDDAFWEIVQTWASQHSGGHGTTPEFMALAEQISGQDLEALFQAWLFTGDKPAVGTTTAAANAAIVGTEPSESEAAVQSWLDRSQRARGVARF